MARALTLLAGLMLASACAWAAPGTPDYDRGFRDGFRSMPYPDQARGNAAYAEGFKAGEARRQGQPSGNADYDRGYRDGLGKQPFRFKDRINKAYTEGYKAGEIARGLGTAKPARPLTPDQAVAVGAPESGLAGGMKQMGYERHAGYKQGNESFSTWRNKETKACIKVQAQGGVIRGVSDAQRDYCE